MGAEESGGPVDWETTRAAVAAAKRCGGFTSGGVPQGFLFMRPTYLRGFANSMPDMATEDPGLQWLIDLLVDHNRRIIERCVGMGVGLMEFRTHRWDAQRA